LRSSSSSRCVLASSVSPLLNPHSHLQYGHVQKPPLFCLCLWNMALTAYTPPHTPQLISVSCTDMAWIALMPTPLRGSTSHAAPRSTGAVDRGRRTARAHALRNSLSRYRARGTTPLGA